MTIVSDGLHQSVRIVTSTVNWFLPVDLNQSLTCYVTRFSVNNLTKIFTKRPQTDQKNGSCHVVLTRIIEGTNFGQFPATSNKNLLNAHVKLDYSLKDCTPPATCWQELSMFIKKQMGLKQSVSFCVYTPNKVIYVEWTAAELTEEPTPAFSDHFPW